MTPTYLIILGLILGVICALMETRPSPPQSATTTALVKTVKLWSYIIFAVGLYFYVLK